jgi:hypothetical protein
MSNRLIGANHLHTKYSSDGKTSLEELAGVARRRGLNFLLLADHLEDFTPDLFQKYLSECAELSDSNFLLIPGVELRVGDEYHLALIGVERLPAGDSPRALVEDARSQGALIVLCHPPKNNSTPLEEVLELLHGVEFWNARVSSRFAPDCESLRFAEDLRRHYPHIQCIPALDLHYAWELRDLMISMRANRLERQEIFNALRNGNFETFNQFWSMSVGRHGPSGLQKIFFRLVDFFRRLAQRTNT